MIVQQDLGTIVGIRRKKIYSDQNFLIRVNGLLFEYTIRPYYQNISDISETDIPAPVYEHSSTDISSESQF